jgi:hypothetical protein
VAPSGSRRSGALFTGGCPAAQIRRPAESTGGQVYGIKADNNRYKRA